MRIPKIALLLFALAADAEAQTSFPSRPITIVVPYTPATGADQIVFGMPVDMPVEAALESISLFGKHVLPKLDKDPMHRSSRMRDAAPVKA